MNPIYKPLKELEKKWGIEAWNDICDYLYTLQRKIEDLIKSRDNWRTKYKELKESKG